MQVTEPSIVIIIMHSINFSITKHLKCRCLCAYNEAITSAAITQIKSILKKNNVSRNECMHANNYNIYMYTNYRCMQHSICIVWINSQGNSMQEHECHERIWQCRTCRPNIQISQRRCLQLFWFIRSYDDYCKFGIERKQFSPGYVTYI